MSAGHNSLMIFACLASFLATSVCEASSSKQTTMQSIDDLYKSHDVVLQVQLVEARFIAMDKICYKAEILTSYKGEYANSISFTAFQGASVGSEYLLVGDVSRHNDVNCKGSVNLHSSSGDIFYPIVISKIDPGAKRWIAMKGVTLTKLSGSPIYDGNKLCQINLGAGYINVCDVFGTFVRWDAASRALMALKNEKESP